MVGIKKQMRVEIDSQSGFCFGVVRAIQKAEKELIAGSSLYCLGDIVHNRLELERLQKKGLKTITHQALTTMQGQKVLFRAHGEPPSTYETADRNSIQIIDATCPVVLNLQKKIKRIYQSAEKNARIVILGKSGHAEVNALVGQTEGTAAVIENQDDLRKLDFNQNIYLFSQTTGSIKHFQQTVQAIQCRLPSPFVLFSFDTICRQVANRIKHIRSFAQKNDLILFVSGEKSSNGKVLLHESKRSNPNTCPIIDETDIPLNKLHRIRSIGICGATSTPMWLMEKVAASINNINKTLR